MWAPVMQGWDEGAKRREDLYMAPCGEISPYEHVPSGHELDITLLCALYGTYLT